MNELEKDQRVFVDATIIDVDIKNRRYYVQIADHAICLTRDKINAAAKTYEDGLREAWETARRIVCNKEQGGFDLNELEEIFKVSTRAEVFRRFTPQKAAECVALWEARQNIQVQDQVRYGDTNLLGVVVWVTGSGKDKEYSIWWGDGSSSTELEGDLTKTGRRIDIAGLLAQIGGVEQ